MTQLGVMASTVVVCLAIAIVGGFCGLKSFRASRGVPFEGMDGLIHHAITKGSKRLARRWLAGVMACVIAMLTTVLGASNILGGSSVPFSSNAMGEDTSPLITDEDLTQAGALDAPEGSTGDEEEGDLTFEDILENALNQNPDSIPDIVTNFEMDILKLQYAEVPRYYLRMCDNTMADARIRITGLGDPFALPMGTQEEWLYVGTLFERDVDFGTSTPSTELNFENFMEQWEKLKEELAEMSKEELLAFYRSNLKERMIRIPQYVLAFAEMAEDDEAIMENNALLLHRFFRYIVECNHPELTQFSAEFQSNFASEEEYEEFLAKVFRDPTEEEIKAGEMQFDVDLDVLDQFYDELKNIPLGINCCLEYDPEHPGDVRYLQVKEEMREFAILFCTIIDCMPDYGVELMTTTQNWTHPALRADARLLKVVEADYQENVPDGNGKIQNAYEGFWMWFPLKDAAKTNRIFAGVNLTDGRLMKAEPTAKPVERKNEANLIVRYLVQGTNQALASPNSWYYPPKSTVSKDPKNFTGYTCVNPNAGRNIVMPDSGEKVITFYYTPNQTASVILTAKYLVQGTNQQLANPDSWTYAPGVTANAYHKDFSGYTCTNPNAGLNIVMPGSGEKLVVFYYTKDNPPSNENPPGNTPTPSPKPDGQGGKTPTTGPDATGAGDNSPDVGPNSNNGTGQTQDYNAERENDKNIIDKEDERSRQEEEALQRELENSRNQGQGGGLTTEGGEAPDTKKEIPVPDTEWESSVSNSDGTTTTTVVNAADSDQDTKGGLSNEPPVDD